MKDTIRIALFAVCISVLIEELAARYRWQAWRVIVLGIMVAVLLVLLIAKEVC